MKRTHILTILFICAFMPMVLFADKIVTQYDSTNRCTIYKPSNEYYYNMCDEGGMDLNYHFGFRFYKMDERRDPEVFIVFFVLERRPLYVDNITIHTRSGRSYTVKVIHKEYRNAWSQYEYFSFAAVSANEYKEMFLNDCPERITIYSGRASAVLNLGPRQKREMLMMADVFRKNFL